MDVTVEFFESTENENRLSLPIYIKNPTMIVRPCSLELLFSHKTLFFSLLSQYFSISQILT